MIGVNALPLLAYKVGPNLFDLSSQMHNVSMRDQMQRAVVLAEALVAGNQFALPDSSNHVLIVGAGVAGVAAGIVLARHGVEVLIIDSSPNAPFALQRGVTQRYVGPYMYEWPLEVYHSQRLPSDPGTALAEWQNGNPPPLRFTGINPTTPDALVADWDRQLAQAVVTTGGRLHIQTGINSAQSNGAISSWLAAQRGAFNQRNAFARHSVTIAGGGFVAGSAAVVGPFQPRFVLLAGGMGAETHSVKDASGKLVQQGTRFWGNDDWLKPNLGKLNPPDVAILGGGDGALQDVLRAITGDKHPLETWERLLVQDSTGLLAGCQQRILALEQQHAQLLIWCRAEDLVAAYKTLDDAYRDIAKNLAGTAVIVQAVLGLFLPDVKKVHLFVKGGCITKAYALNRFLVHLIEQCFLAEGDTRFELFWNWEVTHAQPNGLQTDLHFANGSVLTYDIVAVRFGADTTNLPRTWLGLTVKDTENRQELAAIPLPLYLPPSS